MRIRMKPKYETLGKVNKRLQKVEELFGVAEKTLEQCQLPEETPSEVEIIPQEEITELTPINGENGVTIPRLFSLSEVRQDFVLAKRNLHKLLDRCQTLMDGTISMKIEDMKAGQIEAVSSLANSITMQIQTVMSLYGDLAKIEEMRTPPEMKGGGKIKDDGNDLTVFVGDTDQLIKIIEENE